MRQVVQEKEGIPDWRSIANAQFCCAHQMNSTFAFRLPSNLGSVGKLSHLVREHVLHYRAE
jgi:hypothetical protein